MESVRMSPKLPLTTSARLASIPIAPKLPLYFGTSGRPGSLIGDRYRQDGLMYSNKAASFWDSLKETVLPNDADSDTRYGVKGVLAASVGAGLGGGIGEVADHYLDIPTNRMINRKLLTMDNAGLANRLRQYEVPEGRRFIRDATTGTTRPMYVGGWDPASRVDQIKEPRDLLTLYRQLRAESRADPAVRSSMASRTVLEHTRSLAKSLREAKSFSKGLSIPTGLGGLIGAAMLSVPYFNRINNKHQDAIKLQQALLKQSEEAGSADRSDLANLAAVTGAQTVAGFPTTAYLWRLFTGNRGLKHHAISAGDASPLSQILFSDFETSDGRALSELNPSELPAQFANSPKPRLAKWLADTFVTNMTDDELTNHAADTSRLLKQYRGPPVRDAGEFQRAIFSSNPNYSPELRQINHGVFKDLGLHAHELGHAEQPWLDWSWRGKSAPVRAAGGAMRMFTRLGPIKATGAAGLLSGLTDSEEASLAGATAATAAFAPLITEEVDASRRGYNMLRNAFPERGRRFAMRAGLGLPTYLMTATLPFAGHLGRKYLGDGFASKAIDTAAAKADLTKRSNAVGAIADLAKQTGGKSRGWWDELRDYWQGKRLAAMPKAPERFQFLDPLEEEQRLLTDQLRARRLTFGLADRPNFHLQDRVVGGVPGAVTGYVADDRLREHSGDNTDRAARLASTLFGGWAGGKALNAIGNVGRRFVAETSPIYGYTMPKQDGASIAKGLWEHGVKGKQRTDINSFDGQARYELLRRYLGIHEDGAKDLFTRDPGGAYRFHPTNVAEGTKAFNELVESPMLRRTWKSPTAPPRYSSAANHGNPLSGIFGSHDTRLMDTVSPANAGLSKRVMIGDAWNFAIDPHEQDLKAHLKGLLTTSPARRGEYLSQRLNNATHDSLRGMSGTTVQERLASGGVRQLMESLFRQHTPVIRQPLRVDFDPASKDRWGEWLPTSVRRAD